MKASKILFIALVLILSACTKENSASDTNSREFTSNLSSDSFGNGYTGNSSPVTGDSYEEFEENQFIDVAEEAVSTFSIDADGA